MPNPGALRVIPTPLPPPVEALLRLHRPGEPLLLLDACPEWATTPHERRLRAWSFLAANPASGICARGERVWRRKADDEWLELDGRPWDAVRDFVREAPAQAAPAGAPPFPAGVAGFVAYDAGRYLERLPANARADQDVPDALLFRFDAVLAWDHATGAAFVTGTSPEAMRALEDGLAEPPSPPPLTPEVLELHPTLKPEAFEAMVACARELVHDGDVYQVNLSHRFTGPRPDDTLALYLRLRQTNPAPFAAYFGTGRLPATPEPVEILSSSPERLFSARGARLEARPIAGTRPRGETPAEDRRLAEELVANEKERAEHVMLVDLARNDLGRVSRFGSVRVDDLLTVESYRRVHHLVSGVTGTLAEGRDAVDAFEALFPGGTVTGAPKVRAMEVIDELEPFRRGAYTGGLGYFATTGAADWNILIRTLVLEGDRLHLQVGAGIVWDSEPGREYEETLAKARALLEALRLPAKAEARA